MEGLLQIQINHILQVVKGTELLITYYSPPHSRIKFGLGEDYHEVCIPPVCSPTNSPTQAKRKVKNYPFPQVQCVISSFLLTQFYTSAVKECPT